MKGPNQAMQLTASNGAAGVRATWTGKPERVSVADATGIEPAVYAASVCRRERKLRGMHSGPAAADLVSPQANSADRSSE